LHILSQYLVPLQKKRIGKKGIAPSLDGHCDFVTGFFGNIDGALIIFAVRISQQIRFLPQFFIDDFFGTIKLLMNPGHPISLGFPILWYG
jgi:hypothetical protein